MPLPSDTEQKILYNEWRSSCDMVKQLGQVIEMSLTEQISNGYTSPGLIQTLQTDFRARLAPAIKTVSDLAIQIDQLLQTAYEEAVAAEAAKTAPVPEVPESQE